jgi:hypothetical protein
MATAICPFLTTSTELQGTRVSVPPRDSVNIPQFAFRSNRPSILVPVTNVISRCRACVSKLGGIRRSYGCRRKSHKREKKARNESLDVTGPSRISTRPLCNGCFVLGKGQRLDEQWQERANHSPQGCAQMGPSLAPLPTETRHRNRAPSSRCPSVRTRSLLL